MENTYDLLGGEKGKKEDSKKEIEKDDEEQHLTQSTDRSSHMITSPIEYANEFYSDNVYIKIFFAFLLINPLISLFIRRSQINRIFTRNQIKKLENTLIALLCLTFLFSMLVLPNRNGSGMIRLFCFGFLIAHLCLYNNADLIKGFMAAKKRIQK